MRTFRAILLGTAVIFTACVGTDILDDEIRPVEFQIIQDDGVLPLIVGQEQQLTFEYVNKFGVTETVTPQWISEDTNVATVSSDGIVSAVGAGQTNVFGVFEDQTSTPLLVSVAQSTDDVAKVLVELPKSTINVGETISLTATAWNVNDMLINNTDITWNVSDTDLANINQEGQLTGLGEGQITVTATIDGVNSVEEPVTIGGTTRTATFSGRSGYNASGTATLSINDDGDLILELSEDFDTDFALGTFIYLSNSTSGSATRSAGLEVAEIKSDGGATFNISQIDPAVTLDEYQYVIVLCRPASITFGVAEF